MARTRGRAWQSHRLSLAQATPQDLALYMNVQYFGRYPLPPPVDPIFLSSNPTTTQVPILQSLRAVDPVLILISNNKPPLRVLVYRPPRTERLSLTAMF